MSSGCLIPRTTFNKVPSFDDDLFIDLVDHDFCLKVKKAGLEVLVVVDAQMGHSLGKVKCHRLGPLLFSLIITRSNDIIIAHGTA